MGKMDWKFIFKRRGWSLDQYLSSCLTVEDAKNKFKSRGMTPPSDEILIKHILLNHPLENQITTLSEVSSKKSAVIKTKKPVYETDEKESKYDDLVVVDTSE